MTTGPLGSGFAAGVGMALAERMLGARFNRKGHTIVDHYTYAIVSDGDLMEGIAAEAASFAGHQKLGKIVYLYDANSITIDGSTEISFTENVGARFAAYGWHVAELDGHDANAIASALSEARGDARPSLLVCRTTIAQGSPNKAGTSASHGAPLGADEVAATKKLMDWPLEPTFHIPESVPTSIQAALAPCAQARSAWESAFAAYKSAHPELAAEFDAAMRGDLPDGLFESLPTFEVGTKLATRKAGAKVLKALGEKHPGLVGGSADLRGSNGVGLVGGDISAADPEARNIAFGVREHGMAGICNGLALHGGLRPFDATFLIFSDFMRGAVRLSALMELPVVHVLSHDSILLGEDGPTHQPVEQCMSLRLIPNLYVVRPADANETVAAWKLALQRKVGDGPTAILVTRQGLPVLEHSRRDISQGAYVVWEPEGQSVPELDGMLLATGSEVSLAVDAAIRLQSQGRAIRVVSMRG